ncbi:MAG: bifunctional aldolase/short-chain dehydrogenase [Gammaproteobacteria bacterium]
MQSLWNEQEASRFAAQGELGLRVYSSQLLGREPDLVLHGGGNTSVKGTLANVFGEREDVLYVKGSGWDLQTIAAGGFPPVRLQYLKRLASLPALSDTDMMRELRLALLNPSAPTPSVEAILHALVPLRYVDHTHADAVVAISNSPNGEATLREIYGDEVLILPYIMPGFILAQQVHAATRHVDWTRLKGIVLLHHGIITFDDDCRRSYERMIELVSLAEDYLKARTADMPGIDPVGASPAGDPGASSVGASPAGDPGASSVGASPAGDSAPDAENLPFRQLATLRRQASAMMGVAVLARWDRRAQARQFSALPDVGELIARGPLTPDHSIHTKPFGAVFAEDPLPGLEQFRSDYQAYFERHAKPLHTCLDPMPRFGVWLNRGMLALAPDCKRLQIVSDIVEHTTRAIQWGERLGGWSTLPKQDQFDLEYWELEQAKLKSSQARPEFAGRVVLVTGAASGIGRACADAFLAQGAAVVALDLNPEVETLWQSPQVLGIACDVTREVLVREALHRAVGHFGGVDVLLSNAGSFPPSRRIEAMDEAGWSQSLELNLTAHLRLLRDCTPFLQAGIEPSVIFIGSKNVPAPGPGAAAYSVAKAGLAQLARVAALELGGSGVRVNTLHPNAVFDTGIWSDEVLQQRAAHYGMSVQEYKKHNVLGRPVRSSDVAAAAVALASSAFACTTGAQLPVDGGNERVI